MAIVQRPDGSFCVLLKGAPEKVIDACSRTLMPDAPRALVIRDDVWVEAATVGSDTSDQASTALPTVPLCDRCHITPQPHCPHAHLHALPAVLPMTAERRETALAAVETHCAAGLSVSALAFVDLDPRRYPPDYVFSSHPPNFSMAAATFAGLVAVRDPVRAGVPRAVAACRAAGVRVIMVTGDHPLTAAQVARTAGIIPAGVTLAGEAAKLLGVPARMIGRVMPGESAVAAKRRTKRTVVARYDGVVISGEEALRYTRRDWQKVFALPYVVLARLAPQQKGEVVQILQNEGYVVTASGSGAHDAAALRAADVGVALACAHPVAKDNCDALVNSSSLHGITRALFRARVYDDNCRKAITYATQKMIMELVGSTMALTMANVPCPFSTMLVMVLDVCLDILPSVALIYEKAEPQAAVAPPRSLWQRVISFKMIFWCYLVCGILLCLGLWGCMLCEWAYHGVYFEDIYHKGHIMLGSDDTYLNMPSATRIHLYKQVKSAVLIAFVLQQYILSFARKRRLAPAMRWGHPMDLFDNPYLNIGVLISFLMLVAVIYVPAFQVFFDIRPPSIYAWFYPLVPGFIFFIIVELKKYFIRRWGPESRFAQIFDY